MGDPYSYFQQFLLILPESNNDSLSFTNTKQKPNEHRIKVIPLLNQGNSNRLKVLELVKYESKRLTPTITGNSISLIGRLHDKIARKATNHRR
ncbi:hypothetical protein LINGRAHAP2_LOCUS18262 [Linum grandiflorum]